MKAQKTDFRLFGLLMIAKVAYQFLLRPLVKKAVDDPDEDWDDTLMEILDRLFGYTEGE